MFTRIEPRRGRQPITAANPGQGGVWAIRMTHWLLLLLQTPQAQSAVFYIYTNIYIYIYIYTPQTRIYRYIYVRIVMDRSVSPQGLPFASAPRLSTRTLLTRRSKSGAVRRGPVHPRQEARPRHFTPRREKVGRRQIHQEKGSSG
jgi:hypothetical protein